MGTIMTATKQEFEVLPTGDYLAQITDWEEDKGQYGPQFRFKFEIIKPKAQEGKNLSGWCSKKLSKGGTRPSKLWTWCEAAFNRPISEGENVDIDTLVGRQLVLSVIVEPKSDGDGEYNKIANVKAYKGQEPFPVGGTAPTKSDEFEVGEADDKDPFGPYE
jgi:hypothetical protein